MTEPVYSETVRRALRALPVETIVSAMDAFTHKPRCLAAALAGDMCGCWVSVAAGGNEEGRWETFAATNGLRFTGRLGYSVNSPACDGEVDLLSHAYEEHNDWFKGECIREIAERSRSKKGAVVKAKIAAAKTWTWRSDSHSARPALT